MGGIPRDPVTDMSKLRCWRYHYRDRLYMKGLVYGGLNFARGGVIGYDHQGYTSELALSFRYGFGCSVLLYDTLECW